MSIFYDPRTKKPKAWVIVFFILIPIILVLLGLNLGKTFIEKKDFKPVEVTEDIFKDL
ncbi:MAG: hypothetical protein P9X22_00705 [Candidatus Zapsychrus exili]|nr:hypothetical protein [Candidatus Zapsychrus exili]